MPVRSARFADARRSAGAAGAGASGRPGEAVAPSPRTPALGPTAARLEARHGVDRHAFRSALGRFATGVIVVTAGPKGHPHAMTANAFMSGSLDPPLVVVSVGRTARMHERLLAVRRFGVSILDRDQEAASRHFAGQDVARFRPAFGLLAGVVVLAHAAVLMAARIQHRYACGDHTLFVGRVEAILLEEALPPLVYYNGRYRALQAASAAPMAEAYPSFF
jgi:flavin reductase (DIM6/NTAB) family NADH-FMN oxidoreductase RutF